MPKYIQIKPSRDASFIQMIVGGIVFFVGLTVIIPMTIESKEAWWFGLLWTGAALWGTVASAINAFSDRGIATEEIVIEDEKPSASTSTEKRLKELEALRGKKLISEDEYEETRRRILLEH